MKIFCLINGVQAVAFTGMEKQVIENMLAQRGVTGEFISEAEYQARMAEEGARRG